MSVGKSFTLTFSIKAVLSFQKNTAKTACLFHFVWPLKGPDVPISLLCCNGNFVLFVPKIGCCFFFSFLFSVESTSVSADLKWFP